MNRAFKLMVLGISAIGLAEAADVPTMTIHTKGGGVFSFPLPRVTSVSFKDGATGVRKVRSEFVGFRLAGRHGGLANFTLSGTPGTSASLQLVDLRGKVLWSGSTLLDASGNGILQVPSVGGGLVIGQYRNESVTRAAPVSFVSGGGR